MDRREPGVGHPQRFEHTGAQELLQWLPGRTRDDVLFVCVPQAPFSAVGRDRRSLEERQSGLMPDPEQPILRGVGQ